jgi:hypothetical protein
MGVYALEARDDVGRNVVEFLERAGEVEAAQLAVVVVAREAVVTTALDVERGQRKAATVGEEAVEEVGVEVDVDLRRRVVGPVVDGALWKRENDEPSVETRRRGGLFTKRGFSL